MNNIDSKLLKKIFIAGAANLTNNYQEVDALNVFPVPDGDTGTNMMMTINNGVKTIEDSSSEHCGELACQFAKGLLMGARGNSGVILSQIFRGFSEAIKEKAILTIQDLADAFVSGKERAYKAVLKPVEGTILTVIKDASNYLKEIATNDSPIEELLNKMVEKAKESLAHTPELLPVLKEAGVVDSGGAGITKVLEGFAVAASGKEVELVENKTQANKQVLFDIDDEDDDEDEFGYCTEFILRLLPEVEGKKPFNYDEVKSFLESVGGSIVLVNQDDIVKVHVHTYKPGDVFNFAQQYGEFVTIKVENMDEQHDKLETKKERKKLAIVTVAVGNGLTNLFKSLNVDIVISGGQTMNPSIDDFVKEITKLNPESVIILPNNSNIIMSAKQAAEVLNEKGIITKIVPTTSIQQGMTACMGFNEKLDIDENVVEMLAASNRVICGQITTAVRDSLLNGVNIKSGDFIAIKEKKIIASNKDINKVSQALIDSMMTFDAEIVTIISGDSCDPKAVQNLTKYIENKYKQVDVDIQQGDQPVYDLLLAVE